MIWYILCLVQPCQPALHDSKNESIACNAAILLVLYSLLITLLLYFLSHHVVLEAIGLVALDTCSPVPSVVNVHMTFICIYVWYTMCMNLAKKNELQDILLMDQGTISLTKMAKMRWFWIRPMTAYARVLSSLPFLLLLPLLLHHHCCQQCDDHCWCWCWSVPITLGVTNPQ